MVSFQCNGCGDVFTKPKLEKHRAVCRASFDCIDCSTRFETPADYNGHTSCISEAQKHQKALYNGGKQTGPERNGRNQRSWQKGGGKQRGDNRQRWQQQNVNQATGANDTPLGTPVRMSPVNDTSVVEGDSKKMQLATEAVKKRKVEVETTEPKDASEPAKKRRKKQKTIEDAQEMVEVKSRIKHISTPEVTIPEKLPHDTNFRPTEDRNTLQEVGEKKKKKERKESEAKEDKKGVKKDKKKRKKEDPSPPGEELGSAESLDTEATSIARPPVAEVPLKVKSEKTKKSKSESKSKLKVLATGKTSDGTIPVTFQSTTPEIAGVARNDPRGGRGRKGDSSNRHEDDGDVKWVAQGNNETSKEKRKERKKKPKSEGQTVSVVE